MSSRCAWHSGAARGRSARGAGCAAISAISVRTASPTFDATGETFVETAERGLVAYLRSVGGDAEAFED